MVAALGLLALCSLSWPSYLLSFRFSHDAALMEQERRG